MMAQPPLILTLPGLILAPWTLIQQLEQALAALRENGSLASAETADQDSGA